MRVHLEDGSAESVSVSQYRLNHLNNNEQMTSDFLSKLRDKGMDMILRVETGSRLLNLDRRLNTVSDGLHRMQLENKDKNAKKDDEIVFGMKEEDFAGTLAEQDTINKDMNKTGSTFREMQWGLMAQYVFAGKGSPETCQIVLQLAQHWGLAKKGELQKYANTCMGLDCNGFVGNYLWHVKRGVPWYQIGVANQEAGPDSQIDGYFNTSKLLSKWSDIQLGVGYIMGQVDGNGQIIKGGGSVADAGHLVITEPSRFQISFDRESKGIFDVYVVESTGSHDPGLTESWYNYSKVDGKIFTIRRMEMNRAKSLNMVICPVS